MKQYLYIIIALLGMSITTNAANSSVFSFQWAHSVDGNTTGGDNIIGMCKSSDGNYYVATNFGSSSSQTDAMSVWFDGKKMGDSYGIWEGSPYTGTSQNGNLVLQKVAKDGSVIWSTVTTKGDVDHSATQLAPTSDGGLIVALKCRAWVEAAGIPNLLCFIAADGDEVNITGSQQKGEYRYLIMKINAKGQLKWTRVISGLVKTIDDTHATKNNIYVNGMSIDDNGNIYLAGNFRTEMYLPKADKTIATLVAKSSVDSWGGDSQNVVGDMFLVKLDKNGYYLQSVVNEGIVDCAFFDKMVCYDGKLYLDGRVRSCGNPISFGGFTVDASSDRQTEILASINASDLSVNYVKSLESVANTVNRFVIQNKSVQLLNGKLYYTGLLNGSWKQDGQTLLDNPTSKMLKGYVLQVDPETGHVDNAAIRLDGGIGGFFGVYEGQKNIYAFGYDFNGGAILAPINKENFAFGTATQICNYGTVANSTTPIVDGENFVLAHRGGVARNFSNKASFYGTDFKFDNLKCWGTVYYSYKMGDVMTGVDKVTVDTNDDALVDVYTLNGMKVKSGVSAAEATQGLAKGIYIINHKKVVVK